VKIALDIRIGAIKKIKVEYVNIKPLLLKEKIKKKHKTVPDSLF